MTIQACLLIPIYNHWKSIGATVARLAVHGLPIFIVDDGSDETTQNTLSALATDIPLIRLYRLSQNGGKGAAVMHGMREAYKAGFSHALQIDADGQHDAADVPRFLAHGATNPAAMICGQPVYDASVPKGRLYGRYLTHFWVNLETLNFKASDSMCGFRLYPLKAACALIDRVRLPMRMDFDIEIIVRLAWDGLSFINIDTHVTYPEDGLSHFDMVKDNLRITKMHTLLMIGMLYRLPWLLWRKLFGWNSSGHSTKIHWSGLAERGSVLGLKTIFVCYRILGEKAARCLLYPIIGYFFLTGKKARTASLDYLRRVHRQRGMALREPGCKPVCKPGWRDSFRHMLAFGQSGLDKLAAWMGGMDSKRIAFPNRDEFERLVASGRGVVLIGSHLGNLEMTRALAVSEHQATVNAVVYTDHAQRFNELLMQANADFGVNLIQVSHLGPETAILLKEKIDRGELVVIVGDRTPPAGSHNSRVSPIEFLGAPAPFAQGPFILASLLDCPVYLFFCLREGDGSDGYRIHLEHFAERIDLPRASRQERLLEYMQQYARRLEYYCLMAPEQWFNFYDFWRNDADSFSDKG